ncbi:hypothetical protein [Candidatus Enterococcus ferrettii]|uniref:Uncharacterized protein n=1 Tax=Candidatus Enterococcus ferrettii TaxID=2815324 RepID=A0ABV0EME8_9ENTE|nr:hypothetical protein [Enterococcus sp. 665A]MBO1339736.1 hypothetical protein [Enterococcus sp. 665A]
MVNKLNKAILILYNLCGVSLMAVVVGGGSKAPPVGYIPPSLLIIGAIPFIALIAAHVALRVVKKRERKAQRN